jgi:hypothetical protein
MANLGSESETCVVSRVRLIGASLSFEKNFYRLPFTPPSLVRCIDPSTFSSFCLSLDASRQCRNRLGVGLPLGHK